MFPDHDNPSSAAAAAPAQESETPATPAPAVEGTAGQATAGGTTSESGATETVAAVNAAKEKATSAPVPQADGDPRPDKAAPAATQPHAETSAADAEAAAAAVEAFAGDVATNGSSHEKELKRELESLSEVAASDDIAAIRSGIHKTVGGITASFERMRASNQLAIAQLKDEIRVLHQQVQAAKRARTADAGDQYDRLSIADRIDDLLRRDTSFSVLLVVVRNLRAVETSCSKSLVEGALSSLQTRFHRAVQDAAIVGLWTKERFVAIFNDDSGQSVMTRSGEIAQNLSRAYILNENGEPRMLTLQVAAGVLNHPARTEISRFYPKLEQLAETLAL